jgi:hypothetical protein
MTIFVPATSIFHHGAVGLAAAVTTVLLLCAAQALALRGRYTLTRTVVSGAAVAASLITLVLVIGRFAALK